MLNGTPSVRRLHHGSKKNGNHIRIPNNESPGLYWYYPHPHGFSEAQILVGASEALIVGGIEREKPQVVTGARADLARPVRPGTPDSDEDAGVEKDISLNFVPVMYPLYKPARMRVRPSEREFWRVLNAAADTYFNFQLRFEKVIQQVQDPQPLEIVVEISRSEGRDECGFQRHLLRREGH